MIVAARLALFALIAAEKDVMLVIAHEIISGDEFGRGAGSRSARMTADYS
jgi:hypothetical protein